MKELRLGIEFEDRSALGSREPDGVRDDRLQHLADIQAGAHGLADLSERLKLGDRAGELRGTPFRLAKQPDILDGDGALSREGGHDLDLARGERPHLVALHRDDSHHPGGSHDRHTQHRPVAPGRLCVAPRVIAVGQHVWDVHRTHTDAHTPDQRTGIVARNSPLGEIRTQLRRDL